MKKRVWAVVFLLVFLYGLSRFVQLTRLPVFADEAIYIRWAQIMVHEPQKAFLPMYDGKPPLHMWFLTVFLNLNPLDPLWASRCMSIVFGAMTAGLLGLLVRELSGKGRAHLLVVLLYIAIPFTLFHDRLGLIDTVLTTFLAATFLCLIKLVKRQALVWALGAGGFWGAALMTKTSALFLAPIFPALLLLPIFGKAVGGRKGLRLWLLVGAAGLMGLLLFATLRVSVFFPFLFQRSEDFTFSVHELLSGAWRSSLDHILLLLKWLAWYNTVPVILLPGVLPFMLGGKNRWTPLWLVLLAGIFCGPFVILGKILSARYVLPTVIFLLPAAALSIERLWQTKRLYAFLVGGLIFMHSVVFAASLYIDPGKALLPPEDVSQYVAEWSSGYGIPEVRDFVAAEAQNKKVVVATEGYFGTLPDGLLMYFDRSPLIRNIEIFGVGQPITSINPLITERAQVFPVYIMVNANRWKMETDACCTLVARYPRPAGGADALLLRYDPHKRP